MGEIKEFIIQEIKAKFSPLVNKLEFLIHFKYLGTQQHLRNHTRCSFPLKKQFVTYVVAWTYIFF